MVKEQRWSEAEYLMISGIQHFLFCKRQWALIHLEQAWSENVLTTEGKLIHERVDQTGLSEKRGSLIKVMGIHVASARLGLSGICDLVEFHEDDKGVFLPRFNGNYIAVPIEYKRGKEKTDNTDKFQLLAQLMSLEEMLNTKLTKGIIFYHETRRRKIYEFTEEDRTELKNVVIEMHEMFDKSRTPKPKLINQCKSCSLNHLCLPQIEKVDTVNDYISRKVRECENS